MPDISLWPKCNSHCVMCTNPDYYIRNDIKADYTFAGIKNRLDRYKKGSEEFSKFNDVPSVFTFTGGECTMNPDLFKIVDYAFKEFPHTRMDLLTNGRRFSDPKFALKTLRLFPDLYYIIPLHGHNARIHEAVTRAPRSYQEVIEGVQNLFKFGLEPHRMEIRVVVVGFNFRYLAEIAETIMREWPEVKRLVYIFMEPEGQAEKNLRSIKVEYTETTPYVKKLATFAKHFDLFKLYHFPLCTQHPSTWHLIDRTLDKSERSFIDACDDCTMRKYCLGVHNEYIGNIGIGEIKPILDHYDILEGPTWYNPISEVKNITIPLSA